MPDLEFLRGVAREGGGERLPVRPDLAIRAQHFVINAPCRAVIARQRRVRMLARLNHGHW